MKLKKLEVEGFRSFKKMSWEPGDLNIVIGPNASGKSNLLSLLGTIAASSQGQMSNYFINSGGFGAIRWNKEALNVECALELAPDEGDVRYKYKTSMDSIHGSEVPEIADEEFRKEEGEQSQQFQYFRRHRRQAWLFDDDGKPQNLYDADLQGDESLLSILVGPIVASRLAVRLREILTSWSIHQNFRTDRDAIIRAAFVTRFDRGVEADGQNFPSVLHTLISEQPDFEQTVNDAMSAAFDDFDKLVFAPSASQRTEMRIRWKSSKYVPSASDLSDGTLRFLFLLTVLANPNPPPLIAIDEPETGLHPSMLPIVAELAADAALGTQVILTTHSDQFLDAFDEFNPTVSVTKWKDGEASLQVVDKGELAPWLKEYSLGALYRSGELEDMA